MIKFGPSSSDILFKEQGFTSSIKMPKWLNENFGLTAFEYPFNMGINISDESAIALGEEAKKYGIEISAHAPYYINYGNPEEDYETKSHNYIINSLKKLKLMGGKRLVVHVGSTSKRDRTEVLDLIYARLKNLPKMLDENGLDDVMVCFETMGKYSQVGNFEELSVFANIDPRFNLTLDFGHINCTMQGKLESEQDYRDIFDYLLAVMPRKKVENIHIHFSKIEFNEKGEIKHTVLENENFGPEFLPLAKVLKEYKLEPFIICESNGIMAQDAFKLKKIYEKTL